MMKKKAQETLEKEIKKGPQADKFVKQTYAKQVVQANKNKERYMLNKAKLQSLSFSIDSFICFLNFFSYISFMFFYLIIFILNKQMRNYQK